MPLMQLSKLAMRMKYVALLAIVYIIIIIYTNDNIVPAQSITNGRMHIIKRRIMRFATEQNRLPQSVDQLASIERADNEILDEWGGPIVMIVTDTKITLISYGRDGRPGGNGVDADIIGVFRPKLDDGKWASEFCDWDFAPLPARSCGINR